MKNILFKPYVGENYGKTELGRLLLIGDSHYFLNDEDESEYENWTKDIVGDLKNTNFTIFKNIGKIFNPDDNLEIWSKVAFANGIQSAFKSSNQVPTNEDFKTVEPAVQEYLNILKPTKIIVFSKRVWNDGLPANINWGDYVETIQDEQNHKTATLWKFNYEGGLCHGIGVNHPSSIGFSPDQWRPLIEMFLKKEF